MSATAATPLAGRKLAKQLAEARRAADALVAAVPDVLRVGVSTHADGTFTVALRIKAGGKP